MSGTVTKLAKPQMRGHLYDMIKMNILKASVGSIAATVAAYFAYYKPRRDVRALETATTDRDRVWQDQLRNGLFDIHSKEDDE